MLASMDCNSGELASAVSVGFPRRDGRLPARFERCGRRDVLVARQLAECGVQPLELLPALVFPQGGDQFRDRRCAVLALTEGLDG